MAKLSKDDLIDALSNMTVLEMAELKTSLEDKWGVKAAAAVAAVAAPVAAAASAEAAPEATEFEVFLESCPDDKKISAIKVVREVTGLGLKEAKDMVEAAPKSIKKGVNKADSDAIVKKLTEAGCKASAKGI